MVGISSCFIVPVFGQEEAETPVETIDETTLVLNLTEDETEGNEDISVQPIGLGDLFRTIFVLVLVLGAIYAVLLIIKKFSVSTIDGSSLIKVVGSKAIMKDSAVHLLEVGNQVFLVGSGSNSINLISEITDKETIDNIRLNLPKENKVKKGSFSSLVSGYLGNANRKKTEEKIRQSETFLRNQKNRLKDL